MKLTIKESNDYVTKITGINWKDFIDNLGDYAFEVDSADRYKPNEYITLYRDGCTYMGEVTKYSDGCFELMAYNIREI